MSLWEVLVKYHVPFWASCPTSVSRFCHHISRSLPSTSIKIVQSIQSQEPFLTHNHVLGTMLGVHAPCLIESSSQSKDYCHHFTSEDFELLRPEANFPSLCIKKEIVLKVKKESLWSIPKYDPNMILCYLYYIRSTKISSHFSPHYLIHQIFSHAWYKEWGFLKTLVLASLPKVPENQILLNLRDTVKLWIFKLGT